jgi:hypothetical protein
MHQIVITRLYAVNAEGAVVGAHVKFYDAETQDLLVTCGGKIGSPEKAGDYRARTRSRKVYYVIVDKENETRVCATLDGKVIYSRETTMGLMKLEEADNAAVDAGLASRTGLTVDYHVLAPKSAFRRGYMLGKEAAMKEQASDVTGMLHNYLEMLQHYDTGMTPETLRGEISKCEMVIADFKEYMK